MAARKRRGGTEWLFPIPPSCFSRRPIILTLRAFVTTVVAQKDRQSSPRAQRFAVGLPFRYREAGTRVWYEGRTANISLSGVLFNGAQPLRPRTRIEGAVTLPAFAPGTDSAVLRCRGSIVRYATESESEGSAVLAAAITDLRLVRGRRGRRDLRV